MRRKKLPDFLKYSNKKPGLEPGFLLELFRRCRVIPPERRTDCCVTLPSVPV